MVNMLQIRKINYGIDVLMYIELFCSFLTHISVISGRVCRAWKPNISESYFLLHRPYSIDSSLFRLPFDHPPPCEQHLYRSCWTRYYQDAKEEGLLATAVNASVLYCCHPNHVCFWSLQLGLCLSVLRII